MSDTFDDTFCEYFKVFWAAKSGWTPEQAAYLNCGRDPNAEKLDISPSASNEVSKRYFWLMNHLQGVPNKFKFVENGITYWNTGTLFRALKDMFGCDKNMEKAFGYIYVTPGKGRGPDFINRAVYREAARILYSV